MKTCAQCGEQREERAFRRCVRCPACRGLLFVYALVDPESKEIRYVGKTSVGIARPNAHNRNARLEWTYKARWILGLHARGLKPLVSTLEMCRNGADLIAAERRWIADLRARGCRLTNLTDGGDGLPGYRQSAETIERRIGPLRGRKMPEDQRVRLSEAKKGTKASPETRAKLSAAGIGRRMSPEAIAKSADKRRGRKMSPEVVEKNRVAHLGQTCTEEHRRNLSAACKGIPKSLEWRARMSEIRLRLPDEIRRRKHTPEARAKMSAAQYARYPKQETA